MVAIKAGWLAALADGEPKTAAELARVAEGEPGLIGESHIDEQERKLMFG